jgi:hypothetical protein
MKDPNVQIEVLVKAAKKKIQYSISVKRSNGTIASVLLEHRGAYVE